MSQKLPKINYHRELMPLDGNSSWTLGDSLEGTHIFGGTGSGKTSGSGQYLALRFLEIGLGGLVLTVKPDEADNWYEYAKETGRLGDLIVVGDSFSNPNYKLPIEQTDFTFDFLAYERAFAIDKEGKFDSALYTENLVNLFMALLEVSQRSSSQGSNDGYWLNSLRQLVRNSVDTLVLAGEPVSFAGLNGLIASSPISLEEAKELRSASIEGPGTTPFQKCFHQISDLPDSHERAGDIPAIVNYWFLSFASLAPETRSSVVSYFSNTADVFLRGKLKRFFEPGGNRQLTPTLAHQGKIIVFNLPVKQFFDLGQFAQVLYKFVYQRAAERRIRHEKDPRPCFLWADESQFFVNSQDMLFQTTARSSRVATVYLSQSISNYYAVMPGEQGKAATDSLLGNFVTKIFHSNTDSVTNLWASELISKTFQFRKSFSNSDNFASGPQPVGRFARVSGLLFGTKDSETFGSGVTETEQLDYQVPPVEFTLLKKGGKANGLLVEAFFFQGGRVSGEGKNFQPIQFKQKRLG